MVLLGLSTPHSTVVQDYYDDGNANTPVSPVSRRPESPVREICRAREREGAGLGFRV
jgi:hypothetical protein